MRFRSISTVLATAFAVVIIMSCATGDNGYAAASAAYDSGSQSYAIAFQRIEAANTVHHVTQADYAQFVGASLAVRRLSPLVHDALAQWKVGSAKPDGYDALFASLEEQRGIVRAIAGRVTP